jgi:hypothetical protein
MLRWGEMSIGKKSGDGIVDKGYGEGKADKGQEQS